MKDVMFSYKEPRMESYDPSVEENTQLMDLVKEGKEAFIRDFNTPMTHIYMDLRYLRDWRLGALLSLCDVEERKLVLANLGKYNTRLQDLDIGEHFPMLKYTDADINKVVGDTKYTDGLLLKSPTTSVYARLHDFISLVSHHNRRIAPNTAIRLCVNFYPFVPSADVKNFYAKLFYHIHPALKLNVMTVPLSKVPSDALMLTTADPMFKVMFLYHLEDFLSADSPHAQPFLELLQFNKVTVYSPKHVGTGVDIPGTVQELEKDFSITESLLRICSNFNYLNPEVA